MANLCPGFGFSRQGQEPLFLAQENFDVHGSMPTTEQQVPVMRVFITMALVSTGLVAQCPLEASMIYTPGEIIPNDHFVATGIFRNFESSQGVPVSNDTAIIRGLNSPELFFQRSTDFAAPSNLRFDGTLTSRQEVPGLLQGEPFLLGHLTYTNGQFFVHTYYSDVLIQTYSPDIVGATQTLEERVVVVITENSDNPERSADIVYFQGRPDLGSMRVYENQAGSIEVWGAIGSLNLFSFGEVVSNPGSAFFYSGLDETPAGFLPASTGNGAFPPQAIPEPSSVALFALGAVALLGCGLIRRGKRSTGNRVQGRPS